MNTSIRLRKITTCGKNHRDWWFNAVAPQRLWNKNWRTWDQAIRSESGWQLCDLIDMLGQPCHWYQDITQEKEVAFWNPLHMVRYFFSLDKERRVLVLQQLGMPIFVESSCKALPPMMSGWGMGSRRAGSRREKSSRPWNWYWNWEIFLNNQIETKIIIEKVTPLHDYAINELKIEHLNEGIIKLKYKAMKFTI